MINDILNIKNFSILRVLLETLRKHDILFKIEVMILSAWLYIESFSFVPKNNSSKSSYLMPMYRNKIKKFKEIEIKSLYIFLKYCSPFTTNKSDYKK